MAMPVTIAGPYDGWKTPTAAQYLPLGSVMRFVDGRVFRYARAGAVNLSAGRLMQESVVESGHNDLALASAAAVGDTAITVTNSTTAIVADMYAGGILFVNDGDGEGQACRIRSHPAESTGSASCIITLEEDEAIAIALVVATSRIGLRRNKYDDVVVAPTTFTGVEVGVTPCAVTAAYYFWLQTQGLAAVLTNGTLVLGKTVKRGETTAGSVDVYPLNSSDTAGQQPAIGVVSQVQSSTEFSLIDLRLPG